MFPARFKRRRPLTVERLEDRTLLSVGALPKFGALAVDPSDFDPARILVRFRPQTGPGAHAAVVQGTSLGRKLDLVPGLREVRLDAGVTVEAALAAYKADPNVLYAQPDYRVHVAETFPNDPEFSRLYGLDNTGQTGGTVDADIDATLAWDNFTGNGQTIVAVIDTGVDYTHPDLAANMWSNSAELNGLPGVDDDGNGYVDDVHGYDFVNGDGDPLDDHYHGTHVAGTIGALGDNGIGVAGVNWNAQIMAVKFLDAWGSGWTFDAILALEYAVANGAMISNNSWGGGPYDQGLYDAIADAGAAGHLFVAAAGNSGVNADRNPMYPAAYDLDNIVSVAATDDFDQLASFSNYGRKSVDLSAPGVSIYSTLPGNGYGYLSGTSMATPHVAGVASLVRELHPGWGYAQVKSTLLDTVDHVQGLQHTVSGGRLNAAAAAVGTPPPDTTGPRVAAQSPTSIVAAPWNSLRVMFNEPIGADPADATMSSFTADDVSIAGPTGAIPVLSVDPIAGSNGREFDITFAAQSAEGTYTIAIGPEIYDAVSNGMDQDRDGIQRELFDDRYTAALTLDNCVGPDGYGYEACVHPLEDIDLVPGAPGVFTILDDVDDGSAVVDLGANTFTFYGRSHPLDGSLWVNSNGLITFGGPMTEYDYWNWDLLYDPKQRAIAPLWDDWRTDLDADDQVLGKFDDVDSDGTPDRLIIEWNQVRHYGASPLAVTFQAILGLNGGGAGDEIIFNYPDLDTGNGSAQGNQATVGIKDGGNPASNHLMVSYDSPSPYVGTGRALRIPGQPAPAYFYIDHPTVVEGDSGTVDVTFTVTLANPPADQTVTVQYATADGYATAPDDYEAASGTLTFTPGTTTQPVTVRVNGDTEFEGNEIFVVRLSGADGAVIVQEEGWATIIDDDPQVLPVVSVNDVAQFEGDEGITYFEFTVTLSHPTLPTVEQVDVDWFTRDGTATERHRDYVDSWGHILFAPGETTRTFSVAVNGDTRRESDEEFYVKLYVFRGGVVGDDLAVGTILDDDSGSGGSGNALSGSRQNDERNGAVGGFSADAAFALTQADDGARLLSPSGTRQESLPRSTTIISGYSELAVPPTDDPFGASGQEQDAVLRMARLADDELRRTEEIDQVFAELETFLFEGNLLQNNVR